MSMSEEEAIENVEKQLSNMKIANECGLATKGEFNEDIEAIETLIEALKKKNKIIKLITILEIAINKDGIAYWLDGASIDREEKDIILYDDKEGLVNKIIETMNEIHKKEEEENVK